MHEHWVRGQLGSLLVNVTQSEKVSDQLRIFPQLWTRKGNSKVTVFQTADIKQPEDAQTVQWEHKTFLRSEAMSGLCSPRVYYGRKLMTTQLYLASLV